MLTSVFVWLENKPVSVALDGIVLEAGPSVVAVVVTFDAALVGTP